MQGHRMRHEAIRRLGRSISGVFSKVCLRECVCEAEAETETETETETEIQTQTATQTQTDRVGAREK